MRKLNSFKAKARDLARSGYFYGLPPLEFELSFQEGFSEAREWLDHPTTREELEHLCQESRAKKPQTVAFRVVQLIAKLPFSNRPVENFSAVLLIVEPAQWSLRWPTESSFGAY